MTSTATNVVSLRKKSTGLVCSGCGAVAAASCNCGKPYVPASAAAAAAIKKNPEKSDRAIAAELGVGRMTVQRARKSTVPFGTVEAPGKSTGEYSPVGKSTAEKSAVEAPPGKSTGNLLPVEKRIGIDGKARKQPKPRQSKSPQNDVERVNHFTRRVMDCVLLTRKEFYPWFEKTKLSEEALHSLATMFESAGEELTSMAEAAAERMEKDYARPQV